MAATSASGSLPFLSRPAFWVIAWFLAYFGARGVLESLETAAWIRVLAALAPTPLAAAALVAVVRGARHLDELEQRIQVEALAVAFVLAVLLLMTLGLMERAIALNPNDWSYRHVWAMLPVLYVVGLTVARRRYA